jgi:hypothetical protein
MHKTDIHINKYRRNTAVIFITATNKIVNLCFIDQTTALWFITQLREIQPHSSNSDILFRACEVIGVRCDNLRHS